MFFSLMRLLTPLLCSFLPFLSKKKNQNSIFFLISHPHFIFNSHLSCKSRAKQTVGEGFMHTELSWCSLHSRSKLQPVYQLLNQIPTLLMPHQGVFFSECLLILQLFYLVICTFFTLFMVVFHFDTSCTM